MPSNASMKPWLLSLVTISVIGGASAGYTAVCGQIARAISTASQVYYPGSSNYLKDISHWANSSTAYAACSVEPGTAKDVGKILQIVGSTRTPFAVKGGGHTANPGFSSTPGVQIAMSRFSQVVYSASAKTATIGSGMLWDDVYTALQPYGVSVVGARTAGIGVAGFALGGGYSWKSNQYGLTIDTIVKYELVLPSGVVTQVTEASNPKLFIALKGGFNNFGIVTQFTLKTFPQTQVWGGEIVISGQFYPNVTAAIAQFSSAVTDPKAAILASYISITNLPVAVIILFYDAPTPPPGIFDDFLAIPALTSTISTTSYASLVHSISDANGTIGLRGIFDAASFQEFTPDLLNAIVNETVFWGTNLDFDPGSFISYAVEPFLPSILSHNSTPSAWPPTRSQRYLPLGLYYEWALNSSDTAFQNAARQSTANLISIAESQGQDIANAPLYGNYAIYDTPLSRIYGGNLQALHAIKGLVDPNNVMGLAGGFKF